MRKETFFEVLGELDADLVAEARVPVKKRSNRKAVRMALIAAALAAALMVPAAAYTIETVRYNAAVEYLRSLGIDAADLSDYSRSEIIKEVEVYDAGEDSLIGKLLPGSGGTEIPQEPTPVTSEQIRQLTPTMTPEDVVETLGNTMDAGSGIYILIYQVDNSYTLSIPFAGSDAQLGVCGEDLLKALQPMEPPS